MAGCCVVVQKRVKNWGASLSYTGCHNWIRRLYPFSEAENSYFRFLPIIIIDRCNLGFFSFRWKSEEIVSTIITITTAYYNPAIVSF